MPPDGSRLAFVRDEWGAPVCYVMNADGTNLVRVAEVGRESPPPFTPDGSQLVVAGGEGI